MFAFIFILRLLLRKKIVQQDEHCSNIAIKLFSANFHYNRLDRHTMALGPTAFANESIKGERVIKVALF